MKERQVLDAVISKTREYLRKENGMDLGELSSYLEEYMNLGESIRKEYSEEMIHAFASLISEALCYTDYYYLMTFLLYATEKTGIYKLLLTCCMNDDNLMKETKFFLYYQFTRFNFLHPSVVTKEISDLCDDLYSGIYKAYYQDVAVSYEKIPKGERNKDLVFVFSSQVLGSSHAPTKTLLDRCFALETIMNKKVFIINTAELMNGYGGFQTFRTSYGSYASELNDLQQYPYKGRRFMFFQCPRAMPQVAVIQQIIEVIKSEKPYFILNIGGNSIVSDICSNIVPTLTLATVFSGRSTTRGQFQAIGRKVNQDDRDWIKKHNLGEDHIIESLFTFVFREQTHSYTREELGLPQEGFIVQLVGGRLDQEIDAKCLELLIRLMEQGIYVAFVGGFDAFDELSDANEVFRKYAINLGFQEDVLAVDECCDLYLNPKRMGGGSSAAEAMFKGKPVVTFDYGDVGVAAGDDFHVADWEEMFSQVLHYANDTEYYNMMSSKARKRASRLLDTEGEFCKIIEEMERSPRF